MTRRGTAELHAPGTTEQWLRTLCMRTGGSADAFAERGEFLANQGTFRCIEDPTPLLSVLPGAPDVTVLSPDPAPIPALPA